jgi:hypothetical protein
MPRSRRTTILSQHGGSPDRKNAQIGGSVSVLPTFRVTQCDV